GIFFFDGLDEQVVDRLIWVALLHELGDDAFLLTAGAAGGTGSGSIGIISKFMKERYPDKPVYNLLVLPFEHEETTEERTVYNVATCLKTSSSVADAVFLVDNQRYVRKDASIKNNLARINYMISEPFYNLLCAGEEKKGQFIGAKLLDAGDIIQTLTGWTVIGYGKSETPFFRFPRFGTDFHRKSTEVHRGVRAMDEAITELSLKCRLDDARRALYLFSGPTRELNMDLAKELGDYMKGLAPRAVIRNGDYPRERGSLDVTVILSELSDTEKVRAYFRQASSLIPDFARRQVETGARLKQIDEVGKDIPSLI
ncbi:MAG: cell division protein FtsZ, partial [Chloroflexi bacterium]|nr:cell division protein FtsZ [Chloroflexota bacterium]